MSFQQTVLIVAVVSFMIIMLFIAVMMTGAKKKEQFPPQIGACPDYWQLMEDGSCNNAKCLGAAECSTPATNLSNKSIKEKCDFAKASEITWDGITNSKICTGVN
jgi:hypothetical protein